MDRVRTLSDKLEELAQRPQIVVATKIDALDDPARRDELKKRVEQDRRPFFEISSVTNLGVRELVQAVYRRLDESPAVPSSAKLVA